MTDRGDDELAYDEQNRLISVVKDSNTIEFGYGYDDSRLYKKVNGNVTQVWIGDIYEEKGDKVLCHAYATGRLIATFEPESTIARIMRKHPYLARTYQYAGLTCYVLFGDGRTPTTLLGMVIVFGLYYGLRRRKNIHGGYMVFYRNPYRQITGMIILVSVFIAGSPEICYAGVGEPDYDPVFYYYHSDHLGSSEIMTDRDGDLVQHYGYYPFGDERYSENGDAFSVSNRYTGQILDEDTGLYYYGARYYDPELGRFIQADPIVLGLATLRAGTQNSQAFNRYSYVLNNPLKFVDPTGNWPDIGSIGGIELGASNGPTGGGFPPALVFALGAGLLVVPVAIGVASVVTVASTPAGAGALFSTASGTAAIISSPVANILGIGSLPSSPTDDPFRASLPSFMPVPEPDPSDVYKLPGPPEVQKRDPNVIYDYIDALKWYKSKKGGEAVLGDNITEAIKWSPYFQWFLVKDIENMVPSRSDLEKGIGAHGFFLSDNVYTFSPYLDVLLGVGTIDEVRVTTHNTISGKFIEYTAQIEVGDIYKFEGSSNIGFRVADKIMFGNFISYDPNANFRMKGTFEINGRIPKK